MGKLLILYHFKFDKILLNCKKNISIIFFKNIIKLEYY